MDATPRGKRKMPHPLLLLALSTPLSPSTLKLEAALPGQGQLFQYQPLTGQFSVLQLIRGARPRGACPASTRCHCRRRSHPSARVPRARAPARLNPLRRLSVLQPHEAVRAAGEPAGRPTTWCSAASAPISCRLSSLRSGRTSCSSSSPRRAPSTSGCTTARRLPPPPLSSSTPPSRRRRQASPSPGSPSCRAPSESARPRRSRISAAGCCSRTRPASTSAPRAGRFTGDRALGDGGGAPRALRSGSGVDGAARHAAVHVRRRRHPPRGEPDRAGITCGGSSAPTTPAPAPRCVVPFVGVLGPGRRLLGPIAGNVRNRLLGSGSLPNRARAAACAQAAPDAAGASRPARFGAGPLAALLRLRHVAVGVDRVHAGAGAVRQLETCSACVERLVLVVLDDAVVLRGGKHKASELCLEWHELACPKLPLELVYEQPAFARAHAVPHRRTAIPAHPVGPRWRRARPTTAKVRRGDPGADEGGAPRDAGPRADRRAAPRGSRG